MNQSKLKHIFLKQRSFFLIAFLFGGMLLLEAFFGYQNTKNLSALSETLYKDRLVAQNYILEMQKLLWTERIQIAENKSSKSRINEQKLGGLMNLYGKTVLTEKEKIIFDKLQTQLKNIYQTYSQAENGSRIAELSKGSAFLDQLAEIQLAVGSDINAESHRLIESGKILRELESSIFLVMLVLILIMLKGNIVGRPGKKFELN